MLFIFHILNFIMEEDVKYPKRVKYKKLSKEHRDV